MTIHMDAKAIANQPKLTVISGGIDNARRRKTRPSRSREVQNVGIRRSFFPATPFDAQSLAGTGALVFEGEMINE